MSDPAMTRAPLGAGEPVLENSLAAVESQLGALGSALRARDADGIDRHASELHRAMVSAVEHFSHAARRGAIPPALRHRLAHASGQVAAQRETLARATAALDRAIDVLLPRDNLAVYAASGSAERNTTSGGVLRA
jgi:hypothetical protein